MDAPQQGVAAAVSPVLVTAAEPLPSLLARQDGAPPETQIVRFNTSRSFCVASCLQKMTNQNNLLVDSGLHIEMSSVLGGVVNAESLELYGQDSRNLHYVLFPFVTHKPSHLINLSSLLIFFLTHIIKPSHRHPERAEGDVTDQLAPPQLGEHGPRLNWRGITYWCCGQI